MKHILLIVLPIFFIISACNDNDSNKSVSIYGAWGSEKTIDSKGEKMEGADTLILKEDGTFEGKYIDWDIEHRYSGVFYYLESANKLILRGDSNSDYGFREYNVIKLTQNELITFTSGWEKRFNRLNNYKLLKKPTYEELLNEEKEVIKQYIEENNIEVISSETFYAQDSTTHENQFVEIKGIYMQIISKGKGCKVENNDIVRIYFEEINLITGHSLATNNDRDIDIIRYFKTPSALLGQFIDTGTFYPYYNIVPEGWLIPLEYIYLTDVYSDRAHVRLIVPSRKGQEKAMGNVHPCFYELYYMGREMN